MSSEIKKKLSFANFIIFIIIIVLFCYFRLKPLYFQTVGYTFDQGRDFLKAAEIVTEKNLTFIGPTTGIAGLYHGAWWYYILTIPFIIFGGLPIGYYYFNFFLQLVSFLILGYFFLRNFEVIGSFIVLLLVATSPYFIFTSIFVGNNIMVLPTLLLFLIVNYYLFHHKADKKTILLFLAAGLLLGLITEFELAFGLFLIPSYIFLTFLLTRFRTIFSSGKNIGYFVLGLLLPFIPRILFEFKNHFQQTQILIGSFTHGSAQNPNSFAGAYQDRVGLFFGYFRSLFAYEPIFILTLFFIIISLISLAQNKTGKVSDTAVFFFSLLGFLLILSGLNKDSFFWGNYYEGIQYLYVFILGLLFSVQMKRPLINAVSLFIFVIFLILSVSSFIRDLPQRPKNQGNLKNQSEIINYIQAKQSKNEKYCVKVYTPPAIPYTYNYLFLYSKLSNKFLIPEKDWISSTCWFIIENDDFKERQQKWIKDNLPRKVNLLKEKNFNDTSVRLYERL